MGVSLKIFPESDLAIVRFFGIISEEDLVSVAEKLKGHSDYYDNIMGVTDLRKAEFSISSSKLEQYFQMYIRGKLESTKWAYLVDKPNNTAMAYLFTKFFDNQSRRCFSTCESASRYLGIDIQKFVEQTPIESS